MFYCGIALQRLAIVIGKSGVLSCIICSIELHRSSKVIFRILFLPSIVVFHDAWILRKERCFLLSTRFMSAILNILNRLLSKVPSSSIKFLTVEYCVSFVHRY